jgi:hypothetical protein
MQKSRVLRREIGYYHDILISLKKWLYYKYYPPLV